MPFTKSSVKQFENIRRTKLTKARKVQYTQEHTSHERVEIYGEKVVNLDWRERKKS